MCVLIQIFVELVLVNDSICWWRAYILVLVKQYLAYIGVCRYLFVRIVEGLEKESGTRFRMLMLLLLLRRDR